MFGRLKREILYGLVFLIVIVIFYSRWLSSHETSSSCDGETGPGLKLAMLKGNGSLEVNAQGDVFTRLCQSEHISNAVNDAGKDSQVPRTVIIVILTEQLLKSTYNWLCNTKYFGLHQSILVIACLESRNIFVQFKQDWPDVYLMFISCGLERADKTVIAEIETIRLQVKQTLITVKLLIDDKKAVIVDVESIWTENTIRTLQQYEKFDIMINPVMRHGYTDNIVYVLPTKRSVLLWKKLALMMFDLSQTVNTYGYSGVDEDAENFYVYLSSLILQR